MSCLFDSLAALLVQRPELLASSAFVEPREPREPRAPREPDGASVRAARAARAIEVHGIALDEWGAMEARRVRARHARRRYVGRRGRDRGGGDCAARADRGPLRPWCSGPTGPEVPTGSEVPLGLTDPTGPTGLTGLTDPTGLTGLADLTAPRRGLWTCGIPDLITLRCSEGPKKQIHFWFFFSPFFWGGVGLVRQEDRRSSDTEPVHH